MLRRSVRFPLHSSLSVPREDFVAVKVLFSSVCRKQESKPQNAVIHVLVPYHLKQT